MPHDFMTYPPHQIKFFYLFLRFLSHLSHRLQPFVGIALRHRRHLHRRQRVENGSVKKLSENKLVRGDEEGTLRKKGRGGASQHGDAGGASPSCGGIRQRRTWKGD